MRLILPNKTRAKAALLFISIVLVFSVISIAIQYYIYKVLSAALPLAESSCIECHIYKIFSDYSRKSIEDAAGAYFVFLSVLFFIEVVCVASFLMWFYRAYGNLYKKAGRLKYAKGWAFGGWIVPLLNLYMPFLMIRELFQKTAELLKDSPAKIVISRHKISIWWFLWILNWYVNIRILMAHKKAEDLEQYLGALGIQIFSTAIFILLLAKTIHLILTCSKAETQLFEESAQG
ncbi:MAG: DUF4328 domain-containing protein [Campylobacteraceae bacterium]|jgi:hypothetical protein|nr:DUF4328 domain-containing protein [Campylobacteraceae bacterium]